MPVAVCLMQIALAYEWLVSGINKLLNSGFTAQLASTLHQNMSGNQYGWYVTFLRQVVLPHAGVFGWLTEVGELVIGGTLVVSALLWLLRPSGRLTHHAGWAACLALIGAVFVPLNYFFMSGDPLPWINAANAFGEGVSIDVLISLLAVPLLFATLRAVRTFAARRSDSRPWRLGGLQWTAGSSSAPSSS